MSRFFLTLDQASNQLYQRLIAEAEISLISQSGPKRFKDTQKNLPSVNSQNTQTNQQINWPVDFDQINTHLPDQDEALRALLEPLSTELIESGATQVLIPKITLSLVFKRLGLLYAQLIDPVSLLQKHLIELSPSNTQLEHKFTVYGGKRTACSDVWSQATEQGTWTFYPNAQHISERVDQIRRTTFVKASTESGWLKSAAVELAGLMGQDQLSLSVLACSELSQIFQQHQNCFSGLKVIDLAELQAAAFIR